MSSTGSRRHVAESVPGDEQGPYARDRLMRMDEKFCARLEHAVRRGKEHTPIHFSDHQMTLLRELAAPLAPSQRSAFLQEVARRLHGVELGDGTVARPRSGSYFPKSLKTVIVEAYVTLEAHESSAAMRSSFGCILHLPPRSASISVIP